MTYDLKNVFYLDTELSIPTSVDADKSATVQLDLSSYVDPIARGRAKGTGLAIYKVHYSVQADSDGSKPSVMAQTGSFRGGLIAGAGFGSQSNVALTGEASFPSPNNTLTVMGFDYYGAKTSIANASVPGGATFTRTYVEPSKEVPYVVVRDNVCLMATMLTAMSTNSFVSMRLECAQVTLDQATLNQLLRTQTV
jgi:hypothetical protein